MPGRKLWPEASDWPIHQVLYSFSLTFKGNFFKFCTRMDQLYIEAGHLEVTVDEIWNCVYETELNLTIG